MTRGSECPVSIFEAIRGAMNIPRSPTQSWARVSRPRRFVHEAITIDSNIGIVYETEDTSAAGFYRFIPNSPKHLAEGGKLQMMKVMGVPDTRTGRKANLPSTCSGSTFLIPSWPTRRIPRTANLIAPEFSCKGNSKAALPSAGWKAAGSWKAASSSPPNPAATPRRGRSGNTPSPPKS
ncbi:MAG: DUF839 domain-containing protein [Pirellulaceae bacterium]|nr:DUF839 domain-containing protein [Pirellulaceae bacterium]